MTMSWIVTAAGPTKHWNPRKHVIESTNYHAKHSYRWRCITCIQNWHVHISTSVMTWLRTK